MSYNPNQPRDNDGKWTDAGGTTHTGSAAKAMKAAHSREKEMHAHHETNHAKLAKAKDRTSEQAAVIDKLIAEHNAQIKARAELARKNDPHEAHYNAKVARGWNPNSSRIRGR